MHNMERINKSMTNFVRLTALLLLSSIIYFGVQKIIEHEEKKPKIVSEIKGVKIKEKLADALFKNEGYKLDKNEDSDEEITYKNDEMRMQFIVKDGLISRVLFLCLKSDTSTTIEGIRCGDSGEEILEKYGEELKVLCRIKNDEFKEKIRLYDVEKYGIRFGLEHNKVNAFIVAEPNKIFEEENKNWRKCE